MNGGILSELCKMLKTSSSCAGWNTPLLVVVIEVLLLDTPPSLKSDNITLILFNMTLPLPFNDGSYTNKTHYSNYTNYTGG